MNIIQGPVALVVIKIFALGLLMFFILAFSVYIVQQTAYLVFDQSDWAYAWKYDTESHLVFGAKPPHDCEYDAAPLGKKYCHYERVITTAQPGNHDIDRHVKVYVEWNKVQD